MGKEKKEVSKPAAFIHGLIVTPQPSCPICAPDSTENQHQFAEKRYLPQQHYQPNLCILRQ